MRNAEDVKWRFRIALIANVVPSNVSAETERKKSREREASTSFDSLQHGL